MGRRYIFFTHARLPTNIRHPMIARPREFAGLAEMSRSNNIAVAP
jgi:hypothetical protein